MGLWGTANIGRLAIQSAVPIAAIKLVQPKWLPIDQHYGGDTALWFVVAIFVNQTLLRGLRLYQRPWRHLMGIAASPIAWLIMQTAECVVGEFVHLVQNRRPLRRDEKIVSDRIMSAAYLIAIYFITLVYLYTGRHVSHSTTAARTTHRRRPTAQSLPTMSRRELVSSSARRRRETLQGRAMHGKLQQATVRGYATRYQHLTRENAEMSPNANNRPDLNNMRVNVGISGTTIRKMNLLRPKNRRYRNIISKWCSIIKHFRQYALNKTKADSEESML